MQEKDFSSINEISFLLFLSPICVLSFDLLLYILINYCPIVCCFFKAKWDIFYTEIHDWPTISSRQLKKYHLHVIWFIGQRLYHSCFWYNVQILSTQIRFLCNSIEFNSISENWQKSIFAFTNFTRWWWWRGWNYAAFCCNCCERLREDPSNNCLRGETGDNNALFQTNNLQLKETNEKGSHVNVCFLQQFQMATTNNEFFADISPENAFNSFLLKSVQQNGTHLKRQLACSHGI